MIFNRHRSHVVGTHMAVQELNINIAAIRLIAIDLRKNVESFQDEINRQIKLREEDSSAHHGT